MPSAEIITIGNRILLGKIVDANPPYLVRKSRGKEAYLYQKASFGDDPLQIVRAIKQAIQRCDLILTTGGHSPTKANLPYADVVRQSGQDLI